MVEFVKNTVSNLGDNPYFGAGFGLVGVGAALTAARRAYGVGLILFKHHYVKTIDINHRDPSYLWVLNWLAQHHKSIPRRSVITQIHQRTSGQLSSEMNIVPSYGPHIFRFNNRYIKFEREKMQTSVDLNSGLPPEMITFTCLSRDPEVFTPMLNYARDLEHSKHLGKIVIYEARTSEWAQIGEPRRKRDFDTVILDGNKANEILLDVEKFLSNRNWYSERGIPYRRGYLLHGPPGCGKTSFIFALAGKLGYDICLMNLGNAALSDERLSHFMNVIPPNCIVLFEDVDAAFSSRDDANAPRSAYIGMGQLTLSGILNVLDGVASSEDRIIFMTTNYPARLDEALKRPGRVDMMVKIDYATEDQLIRSFERFYPSKSSVPDSKSFANAIREAKADAQVELSMADIQGYLLCHKDSPSDAVQNVGQFIRKKAAAAKAATDAKKVSGPT